MFQIIAVEYQSAVFPNQGKLNYNHVAGTPPGYKGSFFFKNNFYYSLGSMKFGNFNSLNSKVCQFVLNADLKKKCSSALLFLSASVRHQDYLKPGKPFMALSSSLALEGRGPTSAYKLQDWGPEPPWCARCVSIIKFVALLPQSMMQLTH